MFLAFITQFLEQFAYLGLIGVLLAAGLGVPLPEDIPLMVGGLLSARGYTNVYLVFLFSYLAILVGDYIIFSAGRRLGPAALRKPWAQRLLTHKRQRTIRRHFMKWGPLTIVAARHMAGLRAPCFLMAGVAGMSPWKFLAADAFGACLSVPLFIFVGYKFGENLEAILAFIQEAQRGLLVTAVVMVVLFLGVKRYMRNRDHKKGSTSDSHRDTAVRGDGMDPRLFKDPRRPADLAPVLEQDTTGT